MTEKYGVLLEFDEFFNEICSNPLKLIINKIEEVIKVKDIMDVDRNAQNNSNKQKGRRVSFNQLFGLPSPDGNSNFKSIDENAKNIAQNTATAAISNDSIHKNMVLVKLDLVDCWMKLFPYFDKILNQSQEYGIINDDEDEDDEERKINDNNNKNNNTQLYDVNSRRCMVHLSLLGDKLYINTLQTLEHRIEKIKNHKEMKNIRIDGGYHPLTIETGRIIN